MVPLYLNYGAFSLQIPVSLFWFCTSLLIIVSALLVLPLQDTRDVELASLGFTGMLWGDEKDTAFLEEVLPIPTPA